LLRDKLGLNSEMKRKVKELIYKNRFHSSKFFFEQLSETIEQEINDRGKNEVKKIVNAGKMEIKEYPDTFKCLENLRKAGYKIGVISNTWQFSVDAVMSKTKIPDYIDEFVYSFDVGCIKPSLDIYKAALNKFGVKPSDAVMVGDSYMEDVKGAQDAGLKSYWLRRKSSKKDDDIYLEGNGAPVLSSLNGFTNLIGGKNG